MPKPSPAALARRAALAAEAAEKRAAIAQARADRAAKARATRAARDTVARTAGGAEAREVEQRRQARRMADRLRKAAKKGDPDARARLAAQRMVARENSAKRGRDRARKNVLPFPSPPPAAEPPASKPGHTAQIINYADIALRRAVVAAPEEPPPDLRGDEHTMDLLRDAERIWRVLNRALPHGPTEVGHMVYYDGTDTNPSRPGPGEEKWRGEYQSLTAWYAALKIADYRAMVARTAALGKRPLHVWFDLVVGKDGYLDLLALIYY